jgi:hypothetical protein
VCIEVGQRVAVASERIQGLRDIDASSAMVFEIAVVAAVRI